ncbi:acyltransferase [Lacrimispora sp. 210928-DFI.3.58]|uniref:acyltransferase n=1 Tax=Lacrimispora sp. 210928-DFI.3.58 TaxID=2883214 RepID=UPI001D079B49|nr:acyltransferase [Lacrimispora sp. 210928-DFI.3.58]MCB7320081.1 acyltransferase [Lacrimispora sp. 210928-DFI.3.58]
MVKDLVRNIIAFPSAFFNKIRLRIHGVSIGIGSVVKGKIYIVNKGKITIGDNCIINGRNKYDPIGCGEGCTLVTEKNGNICIGSKCGISNAAIYSRASICIGDRVLLGGGVKIYDTDFHSIEHIWRGTVEDKLHACSESVNIGNDVFIGAGVTILKGVTIGDRAVVGAGAVVTKDILADEIWAGNPAIKIR